VRALIVDDEADSLEMLRVVLEQAGAEVVAVRSATAALGARGPFDVLVSDIGMPGMDGYALMQRLHAQAGTAALPGIALTAYARREDAERALAAGYARHVAKPVDLAELVDAVSALVGPRA